MSSWYLWQPQPFLSPVLAPVGGSLNRSPRLSLCHLLGTPTGGVVKWSAPCSTQGLLLLPPLPPTPRHFPQSLAASASCAHREFEVGAMRQELAALLSSVHLLREGNPGRKIAEIQGKLATVPPSHPCVCHAQ